MKAKKSVLIVLLVGVMATSVVGAASAQQSESGLDGRGEMAGEWLPNFGGNRARAGLAALYEAIIDQTELTGPEIAEQMRQGSTIAEIISASGGDVNAVVDAAVSNATEQINRAVENGRLTQSQADEMIATLEQKFTEVVNSDFAERVVERRVTLGVLRLAADQTGLNPREIRQQLEAGSSLADILTANNVNVDTFIADVLARVDARLNGRVVDGRMTQERADEILSNLETTLNERINQPGSGVEIEPGV